MHALVEACGGLEPNTCYAYLLLCTHFADTCMVAERDGALVGFVAAYRPPPRPDALFVWQVGVHPDARRIGLAGRLLEQAAGDPKETGVRFLEATVGETNAASQRLFRGFARTRGVGCEVGPGFTPEHFAPHEHESEHYYRIGPL